VAARRKQPSLTSYRTEKLKERPVDEMAFRKVFYDVDIRGGAQEKFSRRYVNVGLLRTAPHITRIFGIAPNQ
jgi:hypothetical protein